jgi:hypothetical protein
MTTPTVLDVIHPFQDISTQLAHLKIESVDLGDWPSCLWRLFEIKSNQTVNPVCGHKNKYGTLNNSLCQNCRSRRPLIGPIVEGPIIKGPGDLLHDAITTVFGEEARKSCHCNKHIAQMNRWGASGCREHIEEIVQWLYDEALRRGWKAVQLPLSRIFIKQFILDAIA